MIRRQPARTGRGISAAMGLVFVAFAATVTPASGQCPANPPIKHYTPGGALTPCGCFIPGEEAGATFTAPAQDYPLEIISVSFYWGSQFGGAPQSLEQGVHVYSGGLPNPGARVFTLPGPQLTDGTFNTFVLGSPVPIASGPFTVTLEFLNQQGGPGVPSVVWDADGCQAGLNVFKAVPGGWGDACNAGVNGDWLVEVTYRPCLSTVPVESTTWGGVKRLSSRSLQR